MKDKRTLGIFALAMIDVAAVAGDGDAYLMALVLHTGFYYARIVHDSVQKSEG